MSFGRAPRRKAEPLDAAALYEYAVGALGRRMRTVAQLKRLMRAKVEEGETGEVKIEAVVTRLKAMRYLNDAAFATEYTRLRQENEKFGKRRVQQELMLKGVHPELVATTLETAYESVDEEALARRHLDRKGIRKPKDEKETTRVMRRLIRAGFSLPVVYKVLRNWQVDEEVLAPIESLALDEPEDDSGPGE
jgi:regulatory protein